MDITKYDPSTKSQIRQALMECLYAPVEKQLDDKLERLIIENHKLQKLGHYSFFYKGELHTLQPNVPPPRPMYRLHSTLVPDMEAYLAEKKELLAEQPILNGVILKVLNATNELHDYYKLLPEALHDCIRPLVNTCACCHPPVSDEQAAWFREANAEGLNLLKQRLTLNLLI